jgi:hypothetical protein
MRWPIAIAVGFLVLFVCDFTFAYLAIQGMESPVASYREAKR